PQESEARPALRGTQAIMALLSYAYQSDLYISLFSAWSFRPFIQGAYYSSVRAKQFLPTAEAAGRGGRGQQDLRINIIIQSRSCRPRGQTAY
ncbi:Uncharacterized protein DAT39_008114, partial [Clarias magur]